MYFLPYMSIILSTICRDVTTSGNSDIVRPKTGQRKQRRKKSIPSKSDASAVTSRAEVEELEMSDFREVTWTHDDDFDSVGDEETWMRVVEEGSIPRTPRSQ